MNLKTVKPYTIFYLLIFSLFIIAVFFSLRSIARSQTDFYNNLWAPAHLLVQGKSPYDTAALQPELPALWMPTAIGFFSFLGFFDFAIAQQIWFSLNIVALALLLVLSMIEARSLPILIIGAFLAYFFPPTINHFALGQVSIISALCLLLAVKLMEKMPWLSAGFLAVGMVKPQIGVFILFGMSLWLFQSGRFKGLTRYALKAFLAAWVMTVPLFLAEPGWFPDFIASLKANTSEWSHPSILSQLNGMDNWKFLPWGFLLLGTLWLMARFWKNETPRLAALWTLALTVLITPYVWSWDFVLLLPLFVSIFSISNWRLRAGLLVGYAVVWAGIAAIQISENFHNSRFWWVPMSFIALLTIATFAAREKTLSNLADKP